VEVIFTSPAADKQLVFLLLPSQMCTVTDEKDSVVYYGNIAEYKGAKYEFCLKPYVLSSIPPDYRWDFDYIGYDINIKSECSTDPGILTRDCIYQQASDKLTKAIDTRFNAVLTGDYPYFTQEIKNKIAIIKEEFKNMVPTFKVTEAVIVHYENAEGTLVLAADSEEKIIGLLYLSPVV